MQSIATAQAVALAASRSFARCRRLLEGAPRRPFTDPERPVHIAMTATASSAERSYAGLEGTGRRGLSRPEGRLRLAASTPASPPSLLRVVVRGVLPESLLTGRGSVSTIRSTRCGHGRRIAEPARLTVYVKTNLLTFASADRIAGGDQSGIPTSGES